MSARMPGIDRARSYLYVPADNERFLGGARTHGADAIILDLEDGVAPDRKTIARATAQRWLEGLPPDDAGQIWIRVNAHAVAEDVQLAADPHVCGVFLPSATPSRLDALDDALHGIERQRRADSLVDVIPLIESAAALESVDAVASSPRVSRLGIGRVDLLADLGITSSDPDSDDFTSLWLRVVVASAAARRAAPVAPVETQLHDDHRLAATTKRFAGLGFAARTAVHPEQISIINDTFSPSLQQVRDANSLLARFQAHLASGSGAFADADGRLVDEAVVRSARAIIAQHARISRR